jgi:opacity protein-like surface antigen
MKAMKRLLLVSVLLVSAASCAIAAQTASLSGRWLIHLNIIGRQGDQDCTFTQKDKELTGTCKSLDAAGDIEGTVDGNKVKWLLKRDTGSTGNLNFSGTIGPDGNIKGTVDVPAYTVTGEFTATRAPAEPVPSQPPSSAPHR